MGWFAVSYDLTEDEKVSKPAALELFTHPFFEFEVIIPLNTARLIDELMDVHGYEVPPPPYAALVFLVISR